MARFFKTTHRGVTAVVNNEVHTAITMWMGLSDEEKVITPFPGPIFHFVEGEVSLDEDSWLTGDTVMLERLVGGHKLYDSHQIPVHFSDSDVCHDAKKIPVAVAYKLLQREAPETREIVLAFGHPVEP